MVLLHGLFFSRRLFERLAARLPHHRLLLLDLRGHGRSSRPMAADAYQWEAMASDVAALMDHARIDAAAVGGLSLGANVTLAFASFCPDRVRAAVVEMPVLETGRPQAERTFLPMAAALDRAGAALRPIAALSRPLRRMALPEVAGLADLASLEPRAGAAMLRTLLDDHQPVLAGVDQLAAAGTPTLVIAHRHDALHPVADAEYIAERVPHAELVTVSSIVELRVRANRYAAIVGGFLDRVGEG